MKQNREPEINTQTCDQLSMTKKARTHNGEKTVSSRSDAEKTGQHPENWMQKVTSKTMRL